MARTALIVIAVHHVFVATQLRAVTFPGVRLPASKSPLPPGVERLELRHEDGSTFGLLRPAATPPSHPRGAPLVVYFHGNYELAEDTPWCSEPYGALGAALLVVEYRGYGSSEGTPSEAHLVADTLGLIELAAARTAVDRARIVYHGRSVGGGVASAVARRLAPCALVLESSLSSAVSMGRTCFVPPYLVRDRLDVASCLAHHYQGPTLILHSESDEVIPVREALRNARAAPDAELVLAVGHSHQESWFDHDPATVIAFVERAFAVP